MHKNVKDLTGQKFGQLFVESFAGSRSKKSRWICLCDCGARAEVIGGNLTSGAATSCGHVRRNNRYTHGLSKHPLFKVWGSMKSRCNDPNRATWPLYGGRGIKVCERWEHSFPAFLEDVGERPEGVDRHGRTLWSLDRVDNDKGYEPGNVRWATRHEQRVNQATPTQLRATVAKLQRELAEALVRIADLERGP